MSDFGITTRRNENKSKASKKRTGNIGKNLKFILGTYIAPELLDKDYAECDQRVDVYSLGKTMIKIWDDFVGKE